MGDYNEHRVPDPCMRLDFGFGDECKSIELGDGTGYVRLDLIGQRQELTGKWILEHSGTLYDKWRCSECGFLFVEPRCDHGYTDLEPKFCPECGVRF